ncbi:hypothetical protein TRFO_17259 [Tritrichomonas foetus]|uniref:Uncharacterized protein n=1 Tax=Tritrichomonas foetus TaxID=1144522 RepID=A0A1J4KNH9_9EUKA|nr:hypothetical protein TRFO_17259 [Tritrichomonas foetus]|eukprot:OHT12795.1 hypothetical protein TRFO_17259 [Tritrichomonas foetus]
MSKARNVAINRKKLGRFLDSLKTRTSEELQERKRIGEEYIGIENEFKTIRDTATTIIYPKGPSRFHRETHIETKPKHRSLPPTDEMEEPKYIPASKYALPMAPMPFKVARDSKNASRVLNLSRLRPKKPSSEVNVNEAGPSFPNINIEKLDTTVY